MAAIRERPSRARDPRTGRPKTSTFEVRWFDPDTRDQISQGGFPNKRAAQAFVRELWLERGGAWESRPLGVSDLLAADEVLLASTSACLLPVRSLNGQPIGDGRPGPAFESLLSAWSERVGVDVRAQAASGSPGPAVDGSAPNRVAPTREDA